MSLKNRKTRNDIILFALVLFLAVVALVIISFTKKNGTEVEILKDGISYGKYSISENRKIDVDGLLTVVIEDNKVYVTDSKCKNGFCSSHSAISKSGEIIVCLPNSIVIKITGDEGVDVVI